jgi:ELWxxDGT repeat protein
MRKRLALFVALLVTAPALFGAAPYLVKEINDHISPVSSFPDHYVTIGSLTYFNTTDYYGYAIELWRTDGTEAGTIGLGHASSSPVGFNGRAWYVYNPSYGVSELWSTDGTVAGTTKFTLPSSATPINPYRLMATSPALYFFSYSVSGTVTLWTTNGTTAGTHQVGTTTFQTPNDLTDEFHSWTAAGSFVYFVANGGNGWTVWRTDGTTLALVDPFMTQYSFPIALQTMGNLVVYLKTNYGPSFPTPQTQLWRTDGTTAGTFAINGASGPMKLGIYFSNVVTTPTAMYFVATDGANTKLWTSDGTNAGTVALASSVPGVNAQFAAWLLGRLPNGTLIFSALAPDLTNSALWSFDGTNMTFLSATGSGNSRQTALIAGNYALYGTGDDLWRTDGTIGGTYDLGAVRGSDGYHNWPMAPLGTNVLFLGFDQMHGYELWKTDGTIPNTAMVKDIVSTTFGSYPQMLRAFKGGVLFTASADGTSQYNGTRDLWFSDGTEAGTQKVLPAIGALYELVPCGGAAYFGFDSPAGYELWTTDGTAGGTSMLKDLFPGTSVYDSVAYPNSGSPAQMICVDNRLYFSARGPAGSSLWRSDGTSAGTIPLRFINNDGFSDPVQYGHGLFFIDFTSLWASTGTGDGTFKVKAFQSNFVDRPVVAGSYVYVTWHYTTAELWRSNATTAGTTLVMSGQQFALRGAFNGRLLYSDWYNYGFSHGYCSLGEAGDTWCFDPALGNSSSWTTTFKPFNGRLYYNKPNVMSTDLNSSTDTGLQTDNLLAVAGGRLFLGGSYEALRETDGTLAGTQTLSTQRTSEAVGSGGRLFIASDELYAYDLAVTATGMSPTSVPAPGGAQVTISGRGFTNPVTVKVGGTPATVGVTSATGITFTAPAHDAGAYPVSFTTGDGRTIDTDQQLTYSCTPPTAAIATASASVCANAAVQLQGSGGTQCHWFPATGLDNAASCTPVATVAATTTYTLVVDSNSCQSANNPSVTFTVYPAIDATITLTGYTSSPHGTMSASVPDAGPGATYAWSGNGVRITSDPTQRSVTVATDCASGTVNVTVTDSHGCASASSSRSVTVSARFLVQNVTPIFVHPGSVVTITGSGLDCVNQIELANVQLLNIPFTVVDPTTIRFAYPPNGDRLSAIYLHTPYTATALYTYLYRSLRDNFGLNDRSSIVWRSPSTGQTLLWAFFNGGTTFATMTPYIRGAGTTDYRIVGMNEFGNAIAADILWQRDSTRELSTTWMYLGAPPQQQPEVVWPSIPPATLKVAATADLDGDGLAEAIMRDTQTGATSQWKYYGTGSVQQTPIHSGNNLDWTIVAARDFDFDGKDDILWRNNTTGMTLIWFMNGATIRASQTVHGGGNLDWAIAGLGDFDDDGYTDILWRHIADGMTLLWRMNGASIQSSAVVHGGSNLDWDVAGVGDYNGDHKSDILWRNKTTGMTLYWQMNGAQIAQSVVVNGGGNLDWTIEPGR